LDFSCSCRRALVLIGFIATRTRRAPIQRDPFVIFRESIRRLLEWAARALPIRAKVPMRGLMEGQTRRVARRRSSARQISRSVHSASAASVKRTPNARREIPPNRIAQLQDVAVFALRIAIVPHLHRFATRSYLNAVLV
jgi:hypothetical protein